jgi:twinkle protein
MAWLQRRFAFVKPDRPTLDGILDEASEWAGALIGLRDMPLGAIIDPWNEVEHWRTGNLTEAEYLSACLSKVRQFSRDINGHVWIVAHPRLLQKDSSGKYPVPTPYDVSGGAHWRNKADACIAIHRDIEANNQAVQVHVQKVRFKHVGRVGVVELRYDKITGRYHDLTTPAPPRDHKRAAAGDASEVEL